MISLVMIGDVFFGEFLINYCNFNKIELFLILINKIMLMRLRNLKE